MINRAALLRQLEPGLHALFGLEYKQYPDEYTAFLEVESSDRAYEEEELNVGFGEAPTKGEGAPVTYDTAGSSWVARYHHDTIALGFIITEEAMEDNLYANLSRRYTKALARSMKHTKETRSASVLNNGFNASYPGGDGKPLFATDHPLWGGGTFANKPSTDVNLSETALEAACIAISQFIDDRGLKIAVRPKRLIVHPSDDFVAGRIMGSEFRPGTADNDINVLSQTKRIPGGYSVNHYLTDPNAWFLCTDVDDGLKFFNRRAIRTAMEGDFNTSSARFKASERYSSGWSNPRGAYGSSGA